MRINAIKREPRLLFAVNNKQEMMYKNILFQILSCVGRHLPVYIMVNPGVNLQQPIALSYPFLNRSVHLHAKQVPDPMYYNDK